MNFKKTNPLSITDTERKEFKDRLSSLIDNRGLSAFAKKCALSEGTIRNLLKGDSLPRLDNLISIANTGGVTVEWLATGRGQRTYSDDAKLAVNESSAAYNKALNPTDGPKGILAENARRIIDMAVHHGLFAPEWGAHANLFVELYNSVADKGFSDHAIKKSVLLMLFKHYEMTVMTLEITLEQGGAASEGLQEHIDSIKRAASELQNKLKALNVDTSRAGLFDF